jgi:ferrous iron transport protein B
MWMKAWHYLKKAGSIILVAGVAFWFLTNYPSLDNVTGEQFVRRQADLDTRRQYRMQGIAGAAGLTVPAADAEKALTNAPAFRAIERDLARLSTLEKHHAPSGSTAWLAGQRDKAALKESLLARQRWADALLAWQRVHREHEEASATLAKQRIARSGASPSPAESARALSPLLAPAGLDNWMVSVSLLGGFIAKEVIVGTIGTLYGLGTDVDNTSASLRTRLLEDPFFLAGFRLAQPGRKDGSGSAAGSSRGCRWPAG